MTKFKLWLHSAHQIVQVASNGCRVKKGADMKHVDVLQGNPGYSLLVDRSAMFIL